MIMEPEQPTWLLEYFCGVQERRYYTVLLEGKRYAIVKCAGHMSWTDNSSPWHWSHTTYELIKKTKTCMRDPSRKSLGEGRLTKAMRAKFISILKQADQKKGVE